MDRRIIAAIDEQLAAKSLQKTDSQPDLVVSYHAALNQEIRYNTTSIDVGYGPGWGTGYGYYGGGWGPRGGRYHYHSDENYCRHPQRGYL